MTATTYTIQTFVNERGLRMSAKEVDKNPHMPGGDWSANHWHCTITAPKGKRMKVYFSKGSGHNGAEPKIGEVLDCLASDAVSVENAGDFATWASDIGYDADSASAHKTYKTIEKQAKRLESFLGVGSYQTLLYHTERE